MILKGWPGRGNASFVTSARQAYICDPSFPPPNGGLILAGPLVEKSGNSNQTSSNQNKKLCTEPILVVN
jgi:hypothetical protein